MKATMKKRWKNITKKALTAAICAMCMVAGTGITAFANVNEEEVAAAEAQAQQEQEPQTEPQAPEEPVIDRSQSFSMPGNAEVLDDITDDSTKEFLTVRTANNNTYYLVIDRSSNTENVYMLSAIDENDLKDFIEAETETQTPPTVILDENVKQETETTEKEVEPEKTENNMAGTILLVGGIGALACAGYYFFKIKPGKQKEEPDEEGIEVDDGIETINEDEEDVEE